MIKSILFMLLLGCIGCHHLETSAAKGQALPRPGEVMIKADAGEVVFSAIVQHPEDKPCIDDWGRRVQAFVGCRIADGRDAKMADYFVFLTELPAEVIYGALVEVGARSRTHYSMEEGHRRSGLKSGTKPEDFLQGDPVVISIFWQDKGRWIERPYQDFARERVFVDGQPVVKPWTPSFVFHGSGAIHSSGTGCIACPCDCAGGLIADNRFPLYEPKPEVKFDWSNAPDVGMRVYVRIRAVTSR